MKKILKTLTLSLALILCLGALLLNLNRVPHIAKQAERVSAASLSAPLTQGDDLYDFADALITSWFNDCLRYVGEEDPAYQELETEYEAIKSGLNTGTDLDELPKMLVFITSSYNRLDKIYYLWECKTYSEELEEAYENIKNSGAYKGNSEEIDENYNTVLNLISNFQAELNSEEPGELGNLSLINIRVGKSSNIETALDETITRFDEIKLKWKESRDLILWLSISGGILLLAAMIVIILLLIMRKRNKKYKATLVSFHDLQRMLDHEK